MCGVVIVPNAKVKKPARGDDFEQSAVGADDVVIEERQGAQVLTDVATFPAGRIV